jgi:hypothetical protein
MKKIFLTLALITGMIASAQVRIGGTGTAVDANAILELQSSTKGLLFPNVALTGTTAFAPLAAHVAGMTVYNTATAGDVTPGLYTNSGTAWVKLGAAPTTSGPLYGKTVRVHPVASSITWQSDDVVILLLSGHAGNLILPSASANPNRIVGINNRSGSGRNFDNQAGGDTGIYANDGISTIASTACVWFISDGTSWRVYIGR